VVFSMLSVLRLYNEDHRRVSQHSAVSSLVWVVSHSWCSVMSTEAEESALLAVAA
jgi:hypothetical protein